MSIRHLRTLLAIAERGSFAAAAGDIHLTESAVSMQMKALEEEQGLVLFDRSKRPPILTEAGRALLPEAKALVGGYERLGRRTDEGGTGGGQPAAGRGTERHYWHSARRHRSPAAQAPRRARGNRDGALGRQAWVGRLIHATMKRRRIKVAEAMTLDTLEAVAAMVSHGLGVSIVPDRGRGVRFAFAVRTVALPGPTVHRVVGLLRPESHAKASLAEALLDELADLASHDRGGRMTSRKLKK